MTLIPFDVIFYHYYLIIISFILFELMALIPLYVSSINLIEGNQRNKTIISKIDGIILD